MPYRDPVAKRKNLKAGEKRRAGQPCSKCGVHPRPNHSSWCGSCRAAYAAEWRATKPTFRRNYLRQHYEITIGEHEALLAQQRGACAICGGLPKTRRLNIDHDHRTGAIRGLLCPRCNRGLPWFKDNPALLEAAARYLRLGL